MAGKNMAVAEVDDEYDEKMEDVLTIYEKEDNPKGPVVYLDERPLVLYAEARTPTDAASGQILKRDGKYKRKGTANAFFVVRRPRH